MRLTLAALLLFAALPAAAQTTCTESVIPGNWRCSKGGAPAFDVRETLIPGNYRVSPAPGMTGRSCEVRTNLLGQIVSDCD